MRHRLACASRSYTRAGGKTSLHWGRPRNTPVHPALISPITRRPLPGLRSEEPPQKSRSMLWPRAKDSLRPTWQHDLDSVLRFHLVEWGRFQRSYPSYSIFARTTLTIEPVGQELLQTRER